MIIFAIDPGPEKSAWVKWDPSLKKVLASDIVTNDAIFTEIRGLPGPVVVVIEKIACYGMAVGQEVFSTVHWSGQFHREAILAGLKIEYIFRRECKINLCNSMKAKDTNIRQALIDRFGVQGTKKKPGPLYGVTNDKLAALAVAVTYCDKNNL